MGNITGLEADGQSFNTSTDASLVGPGTHTITGNYPGPGTAAFASRINVTFDGVLATTNDDAPQVLASGIGFGVVMNPGNKSFTITITVPDEIDVSNEIITAQTAPAFNPDDDSYWLGFFIGADANDPSYNAPQREFHAVITGIIFAGVPVPEPVTIDEPDPVTIDELDPVTIDELDPVDTPSDPPTDTPTDTPGSPPTDPPADPPTGTPPTDPPTDPPAAAPGDAPEVLPGTGSGGFLDRSNRNTWTIAIALAVLMGALSITMTIASRRNR